MRTSTAAILAAALLLLLEPSAQARVSSFYTHHPLESFHRSRVHTPIKLADADVLPPHMPQEMTILYYLGVARGHLLASMELAKIGRLDQSVLHSRHALDETWIELARLIPAEESQDLRDKIEAMNEAIALKLPLPEIMAAHDGISTVLNKMAAAAYTLGEAGTEQALDLVLLLLKQALAEYEDAWDHLQLQDRSEYQDGFGFVAVANAELQAISPRLRAVNPGAAAEIEKTVERISSAWPSPEPPQKAVMSKPLLRALVTAVEINARQMRR